MRPLSSAIAVLKFLRNATLAFVLVTPAVRADAPPVAADYAVQIDVPTTLRALIEDNLDLIRWRGSERTSELQLRRLVRLAPDQIRALLATEGYYTPDVRATLAKDGHQWKVKLEIIPGTLAHVDRVDLQLRGSIEEDTPALEERLSRVRIAWGLPPGSVFRQAAWESAKRGALKALLLERFPSASIAESQAEVDPATQTVHLVVNIDSGPVVTFGKLEIEGLKRYPESLIRSVNPIVEGEPYSQVRLLELQARLQDSPYFTDVNVGIKDASMEAGGVPVQVAVTEQPSKKLGFGIGVSTDTGLRGQTDYRDLDFLNRTWQLTGALKLEQKKQSLGGEIQLPPGDKTYRDSVSALAERTDIEGQETQKLVLGGKRRFIEGKTETVYSVRYWSELQNAGNTATTRNKALSLSWAWTRRDVDSLLFPTRGYIVNVQTDGALKSVMSTQNFVRAYSRGVLFYPLSPHDQLIVRGELGRVLAGRREGIPSDFLFRTGGDQTIRGYAYQSLGVEQGSAIVGGRYVALASAEYVHWLSSNWGAAIFFDRGTATDSLSPLNVVSGYGTGVRWKSPVGPLKVDLAYGHQTQKFRLHFSVGFNF